MCLWAGDGRTLLVGSWARVPPLKPRARVPALWPRAHCYTRRVGCTYSPYRDHCSMSSASKKRVRKATNPEMTVPLFLDWAKPRTSKARTSKARTSKARTSKPRVRKPVAASCRLCPACFRPFPTALSLTQHVAQCELSVERQNEAIEEERLAEIVRQGEMDFIRHAETITRHAEIMSMSSLNDLI